MTAFRAAPGILVAFAAVVLLVAVIRRGSPSVEPARRDLGGVRRVLFLVIAISLRCVAAVCAGVWALLVLLVSDPDAFSWDDEGIECYWIAHNSVGDWVALGGIQTGLLALGVAALVCASWILGRSSWAGDQGGRARVRRGAGVWAAGVAITALIDLGLYINTWVTWAHCKVTEYGEEYVFPGAQVRDGILVVLAVVVATTALGLFLWRCERHDRRGGAKS